MTCSRVERRTYMTPEQFIPFWSALSDKDRRFIEENLQTAANPGSGFFSSKRFMHGGLLFLLKGNLRIFLSSDEGREITAMSMEAGENFLVHPGEASHNRKGQLRYETSEGCEYAFLPKSVMVEVMERTMPKQWNIGTWIIMRSAVERSMLSPMVLPLLIML